MVKEPCFLYLELLVLEDPFDRSVARATMYSLPFSFTTLTDWKSEPRVVIVNLNLLMGCLVMWVNRPT
jgi:hypothetical protein